MILECSGILYLVCLFKTMNTPFSFRVTNEYGLTISLAYLHDDSFLKSSKEFIK